MNNLKDYSLFINEGMNYAPLYHVLDDKKLVHLLNTNVLTGKAFSGVSFTRNKMLNGYLGSTVTSFLKLEIDAAKLSDNYVLTPVVYKSVTGIRFTDEREEYCKKSIKNATKYIKKVIIISKMVDSMMNGSWGSDYFAQHGRENLPDKLRKVVDLCIKHNLPIYVQRGSIIRQEEQFIEEILSRPITKVPMAYNLCYRGQRRIKSTRLGGFTTKDVLIDAITGQEINLEEDTLVIGREYEELSVFTDGILANVNSLLSHIIPPPKDEYGDEYRLYRMTYKYEEADVLETGESNGKPTAYLSQAYLKDISFISK